MRHHTLTHQAGHGWSGPLPLDLDGPQTLVLAFGASELAQAPAPLNELAAAFAQSVLVGCSTAGEISGQQVQDASISVAVVRFEHTALRLARTAVGHADDSLDAGARLAAQLPADVPVEGLAQPPAQLRAVFVLSDGLCVNGTSLVDGLARHLPPGVSITGGLAGDGSRFARTWTLDRGQPVQGQVCAVGLYGDRLQVGHGCDGGWSDFGPERRVTRAAGNVLYELDGKPALDLYKAYLGERAQGLPGTALLFPLSVRRPGSGETVVRTILGVDEAQRSMTFAGDVPEGSAARLMRASTDKLIECAGQAARTAVQALTGGNDALIISVSCVGRRLVLGERTEEEIENVLDGAPPRSAHLGFYSYGEISPSLPGGASGLHNQTMTVTAFCEL